MQLKAVVTGANGMLGDSFCPLLENKNYTDSNIKKEGKRRHDLINKLKFPSI